MTNQEAFEKIARHLLTQNEQSRGDDGVCHYRGRGGLKCAIGCLIPDELYSDLLEYRTVRELPSSVQEIWRGVDLDLLVALQNLHDKEAPLTWRFDLKEAARRFGLKMPEGL